MSNDRTVSLNVPRIALWIFGVSLIGPWLLIALWLAAHTVAKAPASRADQAKSNGVIANSDYARSKPGPWGTLEYSRILLEPPEEFIVADSTQGPIRPWLFKGYTAATLAGLWRSAGLSPSQLEFVENLSHRSTSSDAIVLQPTRDFIIGLAPSARAKIYAALSDFPENTPQFSPFRLRSTVAVDWLDNADIPADAAALTRKLMYQRGTATCFSDDALVLPMISDPAQRVHYIKALSRKLALLIQLEIRPGEDVAPLVEYWGRGGRTKDLRPLLESLARRPKGGHIDIVHLIPRFARLLAYTYPLPSERPIDANHDCHWTSFNFQNDQPDERFSNIDYVRQVLMEQYYPVLGPPLLGDIIMFVRQDGVVIHSCVYIADDIVFTKNGPAYSIPWVFSPLNDVQAYYAESVGIQMRRYRAKNL